MAENDLEKYLEGIGIEVNDEAKRQDGPTLGNEEVESLNEEAESLLQDPGAVRIDTEGDVAERCESFLVNLLLNFDPAYAVELHRTDEDEIAVEIFGGDPGKIIGRGGRTLTALEYIANAVLNRGGEQKARINIDVGGYKVRRDERLRNTARKAAGRVRDTGQPLALEVMTASERRIVHMTLADDPSIVTESEGEGRERRVVLKFS
jgi:spoIIIJ-associated protein